MGQAEQLEGEQRIVLEEKEAPPKTKFDTLIEQVSGRDMEDPALWVHYGDPCDFCGQSMEEVPVGHCVGRELAIYLGVYKAAKHESKNVASAWEKIAKYTRDLIGQAIKDWPEGTYSGANGMAYVSKDSVPVRYDAKGLDRLLAGNPALATILAPYRTEKSRKGSLTIK